MTGGRVVEHVSPVATAHDHGFLGVSELHTQSTADTPAKPASGRAAEITCRLAQTELLLRHTVIVDDEGIRVSHLVDAIGQPRGIDRPLTTRFFSLLFQTFTVALMLGADFLGALG